MNDNNIWGDILTEDLQYTIKDPNYYIERAIKKGIFSQWTLGNAELRRYRRRLRNSNIQGKTL